MGVLEDLGDRLTSESVVGGATGWDLALGSMPDGGGFGDRVVALMQTGGADPETNHELDYPNVQVRVRGTPRDDGTGGYAGAEAKMGDVFDALHTFTGTLNGTTYEGVMARGDVLSLGYDDRGRVELSRNFRVVKGR